MRCDIYIQIGGILPSIMNGIVGIHHQKPHEIQVRNDQLLGLEAGLLILLEIVSDKDRSVHMSGFLTWLVQIYCLEILHPRYKLDIPMCGDFKINVCCCA